MNLEKGNSWCRMCYRNLCKGTEEEIKLSGKGKAKKARCKKSRLGCVQCDEQICKACWDAGYDMHKGSKFV